MSNAADRKSIRKAEKTARLADRQRAEVIASIMSTTFGRQWIWDLLSQSHIFAATFTPDPLQTAFNEGERNVGLRLLSDIMTHCPGQYLQAQREQNERYNSDNNPAGLVDPTEGSAGDVDGAEPDDLDDPLHYFPSR